MKAAFDDDASTSSEVFSTWLDAMISFFQTMKNILSSCTLLFFSGVAELINVVVSFKHQPDC